VFVSFGVYSMYKAKRQGMIGSWDVVVSKNSNVSLRSQAVKPNQAAR
jgi:hypothetical protein